jgi:hypothetical protein
MRTHSDLKQQVIDTSLRLIDESEHGQIEGSDVAEELGMDPEGSALYNAFGEACDQGLPALRLPRRDADTTYDQASVTRGQVPSASVTSGRQRGRT